MNIEKLQNTNPVDVAKQLMRYGVKLNFLVEDLVAFSNEVGTKDFDELNEYYWFRQHVTGAGFTPDPDTKIKLGLDSKAKVRNGNNQSETAIDFNLRSNIQDKALGLGASEGNWGADLYSLRVDNFLRSTGRNLAASKEDFSKSAKIPFRCEHVTEVNQLKRMLVDKILSDGHINIREVLKWIVANSLVTTILVDEDRRSGTQKANKQNHLMPFHRYSQAGSDIMMWTGKTGADSIVRATSFTMSDVARIRAENPYYVNLYKAIDEADELSEHEIEHARSEFYGARIKGDGSVSSGSIPEMTTANLEVFVRNDQAELITKFYPWKAQVKSKEQTLNTELFEEVA